jgi:hypothetical protein
MKETISLKGDKSLWLDFTVKLKKQKKEVWQVLEPFIRRYVNKHEYR